MAVPEAPGRTLLDDAARAALAPLGLVQLAGSTTWLDDHGWWVVGVDFETTRARGTRLVVFADFLWHVRDRPARTVGARVRARGRLLDQDGPELVCPAVEDALYPAAAARLAARAAVEVTAWREGFPTMRSWADYLDRSAEEGTVWREYDAAVAAALEGDGRRARRWFERVLDHPVRPELFPEPDPDAVFEAQRLAVGLTAQLDRPGALRATVAGRAAAARARLDLPPRELA
ncbi:MAG: hypothetical protein QOD55_2162 [Solirubrobacteraceae bacterium]|nr:hypothetical protein [Solirubrobacteraceae bacterium]MEA2290165.1 hypothetical protein [Solirubrobacteraceae bacterium]